MPDNLARILIVEDEAPLQGNLQRAAAARGLRAEVAGDGREAWKLLKSQPYDLVVTDLSMPKMTGAQLLARIRQRQLATPVIVITAYATLEAAIDCLRNGAVDFLVKPFAIEDFLESVHLALQRQQNAPQHDGLDWDKISTQLGLTRRQRDTLRAFYQTGQSNRELAQALDVSEHTVKSHMKAAFQKAGVTNRGELLQQLRELGQS